MSFEMLRLLDRRQRRRLIFGILTILWCVVIFLLSSQNGDESSQTSGGFIATFCDLLVPRFAGLEEAKRIELVDGLQHIVRKCAHFSAYLLLSVLSMQLFMTFERLRGKIIYPALASLGFCVAYAMTDELHQYFVPGRSSQIRDVGIDSLGALCGILISLGIWVLIRYLKGRRRRS